MPPDLRRQKRERAAQASDGACVRRRRQAAKWGRRSLERNRNRGVDWQALLMCAGSFVDQRQRWICAGQTVDGVSGVHPTAHNGWACRNWSKARRGGDGDGDGGGDELETGQRPVGAGGRRCETASWKGSGRKREREKHASAKQRYVLSRGSGNVWNRQCPRWLQVATFVKSSESNGRWMPIRTAMESTIGLPGGKSLIRTRPGGTSHSCKRRRR